MVNAIEIKRVCSCINVREDSKDMLKTEGFAFSFYVNELKNNDRSLLLPKFNDIGPLRIEL